MRNVILILAVLFVVGVATISAQIPRTLSYQGVLTDPSTGNPKPDGSYSVTFGVYSVSTGGSPLWSEAKTLTTNHGLFSTILGDQVVIPTSLNFEEQYYLGIKVGTDAEMSPRIALTSTAYSFKSARSDTAKYALGSAQASQWSTSGNNIYYNSGNVGIGTTSPGFGWNTKFDVVGRTVFRSASNDAGIVFDNIGSALRIYTGYYPTITPTDLILGTYPNGHLNQLVLKQSNGYVGIGTPSPSTKLQVSNGDASFYGIGSVWGPVIIWNDGGYPGIQATHRAPGFEETIRMRRRIEIHSDTSLSRGGYLDVRGTSDVVFFDVNGSSGKVGIGTESPDQLLSVNGGASKVGGGAWSTFSDRRLKKDVNSFKDGLSVLKQIRPVSFRYNGKLGYPTDKTYVGVIAQEIQSVAPYTVDSFKAKLNPEDAGETELLRFDPSALTYISINAIKELNQKVEEIQKLREENQKLSARLTELESAVKSLVVSKQTTGNKSLTDLH